MLNTAGNDPQETPREKWSFPGARGEVTIAVLGLYLGIFLHYSERPPWAFFGLLIITFTALYLAYSLRYVNPTSLSAMHITRKRIGLHLAVGLLLILPGWFFDSLLSYLAGKGWLSLGVTRSPVLILSILAVATAEEVFFRGYLLGRLKSFGGNRWLRVVLVCTVFMFYKVLVHSWAGWLFTSYVRFFALGAFKMVFETLWVDWTGSIVAPIVIHIGWDLIMFQGYTGLPPWAL